MEETLLTVREVAKRLRVDDTTVRRWIQTGTLEAVTLPHGGIRRAYRIRQSTLDKLLGGGLPQVEVKVEIGEQIDRAMALVQDARRQIGARH